MHPEDLPPLLRPTHDPDGEHGAAPAEHLAARHEDFDAEEQRHDDERVLRGLRYDEEPARDEQSLDDEPPATAEVRPPVAAEPAPPTAATASEPDPASPVVVGRYNAGSASYIMYSNGMIEVETDSGTHQFASMQELKAFIERRDSAQV